MLNRGGIIRHLWKSIRRWKWPLAAIMFTILMTYVIFWTGPQPYQTSTFGILPVFMSYLLSALCLFIIFLQVLYEHYTKAKTYYICKSCNKNFTLEGYDHPDARCPFCSSNKLHVVITAVDKEQKIKGLLWNPPGNGEKGTKGSKKAYVGITLCVLFLTVTFVTYGYYDYYIRKRSVSIIVILNLRDFGNRPALIEVYDLNNSYSQPSSWAVINFTGHLDTKQSYDSGRVLSVRIVAFNDSSFKRALEAKRFTISIPYLTQSEISYLFQIETNNMLTLPLPPLSMVFDLDWKDGVIE
jgi:DNA-directed RNA polymerase subunit RPC12/RpoP